MGAMENNPPCKKPQPPNPPIMKHLHILLACLLTLASCEKEAAPPPLADVKVSGSAFIRTRGGDTIKLSGQEVIFYREAAVIKTLDEANASALADSPDYSTTIEKYKKMEASWAGMSGFATSYERENAERQRKEIAAHIVDLEYAKETWPSANYVFTFLPTPVQGAHRCRRRFLHHIAARQRLGRRHASKPRTVRFQRLRRRGTLFLDGAHHQPRKRHIG